MVFATITNVTLVQLVTEQDEPIGETDVRTAHLGNGLLHRAVSVFLFRAGQIEPELLLQQRSNSKIVAAGLWANTACGNVWPGESYAACAQRRLADELGILDTPATDLTDLYTFRYQVRCSEEMSENELDHVFVGTYDGMVQPNSTEVQNWEWVAWSKLLADAPNNPEYAPWLQLLLNDAALKTTLEEWMAQQLLAQGEEKDV